MSGEETDTPRVDKKNRPCDEYGFPIEGPMLKYQEFLEKHTHRKLKTQQVWRDVKLPLPSNRKKLHQLMADGIPNEFRPHVWLALSGALKLKDSANYNTETGTYYQWLVDTNKRQQEKGKIMAPMSEIEKDLPRTFPGHVVIESVEGQEKLRRILEAYARKNKPLGYCQSMNYITGWMILFMEEEDAFWLLTHIVEELAPGTWSKSMISIQVDGQVLADLIREKLPKLHQHIESIKFMVLIIATKWFMCLFVGILPSETVLRLWDYLFLYGSSFLFRVALAILQESQDDLLITKDTMQFCRKLHECSMSLFDYKELLNLALKYNDVNEERIEDLRTRHKLSFDASLSPDQLKQLKEQLDNQVSSSQEGVVSSFYTAFNNWYKRSKDGVNTFVAKKQVQFNKLKAIQQDENLINFVKECASTHLKNEIDFIVSGTGVRFYPNGKKYEGNFADNKRSGYGILYNAEGTMEYDGFWKYDRRDGVGHSVDKRGNYKGDWKQDEYHGRGVLRSIIGVYDGEWRGGKMDGRGTMTYASGDKYEGDWKNDKQHGKGIMHFVNGNIYKGDWVNNKIEGKGSLLVFATGDKYDGSFHNDAKHGIGKFYWATGSSYEGDWKNNIQEGKGIMIYSNGEEYRGDWVGNKREGRGIHSFLTEGPDKQKQPAGVYDGEWKNDQMNGQGTFTLPDGTIFEGTWENGLRVVNGVKFYKDGRRVDDENQKATPTNLKSVTAAIKSNTLSKAIDDIKRRNSVQRQSIKNSLTSAFNLSLTSDNTTDSSEQQ